MYGIYRNDIQRIKIVLGNKIIEQETEFNCFEYPILDPKRNMEINCKLARK
jgi:hypothetical protein